MVGGGKREKRGKTAKKKENQAVDWGGRKSGALSSPQTPAQFASLADFFCRLSPSQQSLLPGPRLGLRCTGEFPPNDCISSLEASSWCFCSQRRGKGPYNMYKAR